MPGVNEGAGGNIARTGAPTPAVTPLPTLDVDSATPGVDSATADATLGVDSTTPASQLCADSKVQLDGDDKKKVTNNLLKFSASLYQVIHTHQLID